MREIKSITELINCYNSNKEIYQEINGKKYIFLKVRILGTTLGELNRMVLEGILYYDILS